MTPEEKSLLERTHKLAEENNKMLHALRRNARLGTILRVVYWVIIIVLSFGAFYLIQPYVNSLTSELGFGGDSAATSTSISSELSGLMQLYNSQK